MLLREYLYVDTTIVRGLLAQLDAGIVESEITASGKDKKTSGGLKGLVEHSQNWGDHFTTTKAMADALFPKLEETLETEELLEDISHLLVQKESWSAGNIERALPPGKIVRATAPGYLIDARFIATFLSGFAVANRGLVNMGIFEQVTQAAVPPRAKLKGRKAYEELPGERESLESAIPLGKLHFGAGDDGDITGEFFRGIVQVARGMFAPGLHLSLSPEVDRAGAISVRLQEGRQYLDMDPDILFAHYGVGAQEWTVVGTVGHHPLPDPDMANSTFMNQDGGVRRGEFGRYVNQMGTMLANLGFTDLPQAPGFSIIPWAVYRTIGAPPAAP